MKRSALWLALLLGLGIWCAIEASRAFAGPRVELAENRQTELTSVDRQRLAELDRDVTLTYWVSSRERMPSSMRQVERGVLELLEALEQAAQQTASTARVSWRHADPESKEELQTFASQRGISPIRVRSVSKDGWSEREVYSSLELQLGATGRVVLDGIDRETLPALKGLILEHLGALESPPRPRFALAAPESGYEQLASYLGARGELLRVDGNALAADLAADVLVWMEPGSPPEEALEALDQLRERGVGVLLAGSARRSTLGMTPDASGAGRQAALRIEPSGFDADRVLARFGLRALESPLFDERCEAQMLEGQATRLPFLARCIGPNQDFRGFEPAPSGSILFPSPTALRLDGASLLESGVQAKVLATSSEASYTVPELAGAGPFEPVRLAALDRERHRALPKEALLVALEPARSLHGRAFVAASPKPFSDEFLDLEGYVHRDLLSLLVGQLASPARLVASRAEVPRPARIDPVSPSAERIWRLLVLGLGPAALAGLFVATGGLGARGRSGRGGARLGVTALVAVAIAFAVPALGAALGRVRGPVLDLTADALSQPAGVNVDLLAEVAAENPLQAAWLVSPTTDLPPNLRAPARAARERLDVLLGTSSSASWAPTPDWASVDEQRAPRLRAVVGEGEITRVIDFRSSLELTAGNRTERLDFPDALAFEDFEFRVGFALWRLAGNAPPRIAMATDTPRLTPAEAHSEYLQLQRFAPTGTDIFSLARASLQLAGFDVVHVDSARADVPENADSLFWLQPRRPLARMLEAFALHLTGGGKAFLAAQHFQLIPQQHRGRDFETVWWPRPQFCDLEQLYFPGIGLVLARDVLFDRLNYTSQVLTQVNRDPRARDYERQDSSLPALIRAVVANQSDDPLLAGVGDLRFPFPNRVFLDEAQLAAVGLTAEVLATTSASAWNYAWEGGFLPSDVLAGPSESTSVALPAGVDSVSRAPLLVRVRGSFPQPPSDLVDRAEGELPPLPPEPGAGELVLIGNSAAFDNERLLRPDSRGDRLLVAAAAHQTLPPGLAALTGRRSVPPGLDLVPEDSRLIWRGAVLLAGPLTLLLLAALGSLRRIRA